jgi:hypothetical protein
MRSLRVGAGLREWKRMGSGDPPGLQNRRVASLMSPVRSTRTRFRQFVFSEMQGPLGTSQREIDTRKRGVCDKNVIV